MEGSQPLDVLWDSFDDTSDIFEKKIGENIGSYNVLRWGGLKK